MTLDMNHYQLTIDNLTPVKFWANNSQLKYRLHSAYITFNHKHQLNKTLLYIHHPVQGWCQVCDTKNCYPTISNPLKLDYNKLIMAIFHTLTQAKQLPSTKQKQQRKQWLAGSNGWRGQMAGGVRSLIYDNGGAGGANSGCKCICKF